MYNLKFYTTQEQCSKYLSSFCFIMAIEKSQFLSHLYKNRSKKPFDRKKNSG
jgi:hypothetical protein